MSNPGVEQREYRITGRVQGVFFRVWTRDTALAMGLQGTVKNLPDGSVEAQVLGSRELLEEFEDRLWTGPPAAVVEGVESRTSQAPLPGAGFMILY